MRLQSYLYLRDLETGRDRQLFGNVDKDLQEAWAVHGLYPQYAWMPDGKAIVIWGEGKIWRVDVASGKGTQIPFTRARRTDDQRCRPLPAEGASRRVPGADAARRAGLARRQDGRLQRARASLSVGCPTASRSASRKDDRLRVLPVVLADGQWIVYTTWTDAEMGRVRVMQAGRLRQAATSSPGPATTSSRRSRPTARRSSSVTPAADLTRGAAQFGDGPGIYVVPAGGRRADAGRATAGAEPEFDHTGTRIYVRDIRNEQVTLLSVGVPADATRRCPGATRSSTFAATNATQYAIVAERQVDRVRGALQDVHRAVPAHRPSGRDRSGDAGLSGAARLARRRLLPALVRRQPPGVLDARSRAVHARPGRTFTLRRRRAAPKAATSPRRRAMHIGFTVKSDKPTGDDRARRRAGHHHGRLKPGPIPGTPGVIENATDRRSKATGSSPSARRLRPRCRPARDAIDVKGKTIMPGIVDVHAHLGGESSGLLAQSSWPLAANLAFGVTTSHDPSNDTETVFTNAELIRSGAKLGPRLFSTGTILYGAETPFKAVVESYDDALSHLRRQKAVGAFSVKSYNQQRRDARQMMIKAARELEMMVVPEGGSLLYMNQTHVLDGHTGVEHSLPVPRIYKDTIELFAKSKSGYTPTRDRRLRRTVGRVLLVPDDQRLGERAAAAVHAARGRRPAVAPPDDGAARRLQPRPDRQGRQADRRRRRDRCSSARTASCRGSARTGSCGCCSRAA